MKKVISAIYVIGCLLCTVCTPLSAIFIVCKFVDCLLYSAFNRVSGFALAYNHKSDYQRERKIGGKNAETKQK